MKQEKIPHPSLKVKVYNRDGYYFTHKDLVTDHIKHWEPVLGDYIGRPCHILEIGSLQGNSAVYWLNNVLTHRDSRLWCVEPFGRTKRVPDRELFLENIGKTGQANKVTLLEMTSDVFFQKKGRKKHDVGGFNPQQEQEIGGLNPPTSISKGGYGGLIPQMEVIYVDGSHEADVVARDCVHSYDFCKIGGIIIMDDYKMPRVFADDKIGPKPSIDGFLETYADKVEVLHKGYQVIVKKIA